MAPQLRFWYGGGVTLISKETTYQIIKHFFTVKDIEKWLKKRRILLDGVLNRFDDFHRFQPIFLWQSSLDPRFFWAYTQPNDLKSWVSANSKECVSFFCVLRGQLSVCWKRRSDYDVSSFRPLFSTAKSSLSIIFALQRPDFCVSKYTVLCIAWKICRESTQACSFASAIVCGPSALLRTWWWIVALHIVDLYNDLWNSSIYFDYTSHCNVLSIWVIKLNIFSFLWAYFCSVT